MTFCDYDSTNPTETCGKDGFRVWLSSSPRQRWPVANPFGVVGGPRRALGTFGQSGEPRQCHTWRRFVDLEVTVSVASASGCTSDRTISANRLGVKYRKVVHNFVFVPMKWVSFSFLQGWHCWKQTVIRKVSSFGCATFRQIYQLFWWIQWWIPTSSLTHLACLVFDVFGLPFPRPFLQEIHQLLEIPFGRATGHGKSTMAWTVSELASGNAGPSSMATERWSEDSAKHVLKWSGEDRGIGRNGWSKSVESGKMMEDVLLLLDVSVCNLGWSLAQALHAVCTNSGSNLRHHQGRVQRFTCLNASHVCANIRCWSSCSQWQDPATTSLSEEGYQTARNDTHKAWLNGRFFSMFGWLSPERPAFSSNARFRNSIWRWELRRKSLD